MMRHYWWKILAAVLMIYTLVIGFLMPLRPGITSVSPQNLKVGEDVSLSVKTYNAKLDQINPSEIRAWLRNGNEYLLQASGIEVLNNQHLNVNFSVPEYLPVDQNILDFSLILDAPNIGSFVIPSSVFIQQDSLNSLKGREKWTGSRLDKLSEYKGLAIPFRNILIETLRNTYFHVSLWFSMFILYLISVVYSVRYLRKRDSYFDNVASSLVRVGTAFGMLGLATGSVWAKNTWGTYWTGDVKLNMAAISMMIYAAYIVLRMSIEDNERRSVIASSYNIFAFFIIIPLIFVIPRMTDSLHPGNGGNPGFGTDDMDNTMRMVFYPSIIAFTLIGLWLANLNIRINKIKEKLNDKE